MKLFSKIFFVVFVFSLCLVTGCKKSDDENKENDEHIHSYVDGICSCGDRKYNNENINYSSDGLEYVLNEDGKSYSVVGVSKIAKHVLIPSYYNDLPVTTVDYEAFEFAYNMESLKISKNIVDINVGDNWECVNLTRIEVDGENPVYDSRENCNAIIHTATNSLLMGCFMTTIPNSVTIIDEFSFVNCVRLTKIDIPNNIVKIGDGAFENCTSLTNIVIPKSVQDLHGAFEGCTSLISVTLLNDIKSISDFSFRGCEKLKNINIPNSVERIGYDAFSGCSSLETIEIPDRVTSIGGYAFSECSSLTSIVIPESVTSVGYNAFSGCSSLTIYCETESTPSEWNFSWNGSNRPVVWGYTSK